MGQVQVVDRQSSRIELNGRQSGEGRDLIVRQPGDNDALDVEQLVKFLQETRNEPAWRRQADIDADYYDGNQLRQDTLQEMEARGIPPLIINLTQPIINTVLGMEAKARSDWQITSDNGFDEVAQAIDARMSEVERESNADRAISDAYASQIKSGLGWIEVNYESNPFAYRYRVTPVHRREIWWDWRDLTVGLDKARYLIRRRWFDQDELTAAMPQHEELIRGSINRWNGFIENAFLQTQQIEHARSWDAERAWTLDEYEWRDTLRRRAQLFEVWYRVWKRGHVMRLPNGQVIEVNRANPRHMEAIASGWVNPIPAVYPKMRVSLWIGPHRVSDRPSPLPHNSFPYVPFWGFREDLTGAPYGLVRALRSPQDEVNARRSKLLSLLTGRRATVDADAIDTTFNSHQDVADELGRPDPYIVLNPGRKNGVHGFKVENNGDLAQGQMATLTISKEEMHAVSGVFPPTMGDAKQALSGVAVDALVDQSTVTLAEINDNHRYGRRQVGLQLVSLIKADMVGEMKVDVGEGKKKKTIILNKPVYNEAARADVLENSVEAAAIKVTLSEVPSTQTYRQKQFMLLTELTKGLPPEVQTFVIDFVIEASDVKDRMKVADRLRKKLGIGDDDDEASAQNQQMMAQHQEAIAKLSEQLQKLAEENQQLKVGNANKEQEIALALKKEETRQAEVASNELLTRYKIDTDAKIAIEKTDLEHEKIASGERQAKEAAAAAASAPVPEAPDTDAMIASVTDDIRNMVKALADELGNVSKEVQEAKKVAEGAAKTHEKHAADAAEATKVRAAEEKGEAKVPQIKPDDIAAALTKAIAPLVETKQGESDEGGDIEIVRDAGGKITGARKSGGGGIEIVRDANGKITGARKKKSGSKKK
ncbi:MAG TPA: hypothetical protein PKV98_04530 [Burkholderiaceae bacterium]|nr:hypothetical protein [Burkholderiaceae bacterium]